MKVEQLPSGTYRVRIMIDGQRYTFTDKVKRIRDQGYVTKYKTDQISHYFRRMQQRIGIEDAYNFHSTRHYCVSTLHANGLPDAYIMERGGWATTDVLNYVYRHTFSSQSAALTGKALNHFDSVTKFVTK